MDKRPQAIITFRFTSSDCWTWLEPPDQKLMHIHSFAQSAPQQTHIRLTFLLRLWGVHLTKKEIKKNLTLQGFK